MHFRSAPSWRGLAGWIGTVNALLLVAATELLSSFQQIRAGPVFVAWVAFVALQFPAWVRAIRAVQVGRHPPDGMGRLERSILLTSILIGISTGLLAFTSTPNTWDSLLYHLTRVSHWIQNQSVEFFPTSNERQLFFPPFAEYVLLHLDLLSGGDRLAGLVQWMSFLGCLAGVSLIARELGAGRLGQLLALFFTATIPTAILEASSTQNDLVVTLWLVWFCYHAIRFVNHGARYDAIAGTAALGLGLLTKLTAPLLLPGFAIGFMIQALRARKGPQMPLVGLSLVLAVGVFSGFTTRNLATYGVPVASQESRADHAARQLSLALLGSNLLRGLAPHLSVPPIRLHLPDHVKEMVQRFEQRAGIEQAGAELDAADWRYTAAREDRAGAPVHLLLVVCLLGLTTLRPTRLVLPPAGRWLLVGLAIGVLVLAAGLQWNPWVVRFHMSLLILSAPVVGLLAERRLRPPVVVVVGALLLLSGGYSLLSNELHPVFGPRALLRAERRTEYLAAWDERQRNNLLRMIDKLSKRFDRVIGLDLDEGSPEYPFWALTSGVRNGRRHLCHVRVPNRSRALSVIEKCAPTIIVSNRTVTDTLSIEDNRYHMIAREGSFVMLSMAGPQ